MPATWPSGCSATTKHRGRGNHRVPPFDHASGMLDCLALGGQPQSCRGRAKPIVRQVTTARRNARSEEPETRTFDESMDVLQSSDRDANLFRDHAGARLRLLLAPRPVRPLPEIGAARYEDASPRRPATIQPASATAGLSGCGTLSPWRAKLHEAQVRM
jgi:hypothetical protein